MIASCGMLSKRAFLRLWTRSTPSQAKGEQAASSRAGPTSMPPPAAPSHAKSEQETSGRPDEGSAGSGEVRSRDVGVRRGVFRCGRPVVTGLASVSAVCGEAAFLSVRGIGLAGASPVDRSPRRSLQWRANHAAASHREAQLATSAPPNAWIVPRPSISLPSHRTM